MLTLGEVGLLDVHGAARPGQNDLTKHLDVKRPFSPIIGGKPCVNVGNGLDKKAAELAINARKYTS